MRGDPLLPARSGWPWCSSPVATPHRPVPHDGRIRARRRPRCRTRPPRSSRLPLPTRGRPRSRCRDGGPLPPRVPRVSCWASPGTGPRAAIRGAPGPRSSSRARRAAGAAASWPRPARTSTRRPGPRTSDRARRATTCCTPFCAPRRTSLPCCAVWAGCTARPPWSWTTPTGWHPTSCGRSPRRGRGDPTLTPLPESRTPRTRNPRPRIPMRWRTAPVDPHRVTARQRWSGTVSRSTVRAPRSLPPPRSPGCFRACG